MRTNIFPFQNNFLIQGEIAEVQLNHLTATELERIVDTTKKNVLYLGDVYESVVSEALKDAEDKGQEGKMKCLEYINIDLLQLTGEKYIVGHFFECIDLIQEEDGYVLTAHIRQRAVVRDFAMEENVVRGISNEFPMDIDLDVESRMKKVDTIFMYIREIEEMQLEYLFDKNVLDGKAVERTDFNFGQIQSFIQYHNEIMKFMKELVLKLPMEPECVRRMMDSSTEKDLVSEFTRYLRIWRDNKLKLYRNINEKYRLLMSYDNQQNDLRNLKNNLEAQLIFVKGKLKASHDEENDLLKRNSPNKKVGYADLIEASGMPDDIKWAALEEVERLSQITKDNSEYYKLCNYLDFMVALPWKKEPEKKFDIAKARELLNKSHHGMEKVKQRIIQQLAAQQFKKDKKGTVLLLIGPPGVGKTSIAQSIAKALGREYVRLSLGGVSCEEDLRGFQRTYIGSKGGRILESMKAAGTTNPVLVLDEIDKLGTDSHRGDPSSALLEVLDPNQNHGFVDRYLNLPYDLSDVFFVATANDRGGIPGPLRDRMEVIELSSYTSDEKFHIAKDYIYSKTLDDAGLSSKQLRITGGAIKSMISDYTYEAGVRDLQRKFETICRVASEKLLAGEEPVPLRVKASNLEEYLGDKVRRNDTILSTNPSGVVTALVASMAGGGVSLVESIKMPGTGQVELTGQLGDVIQESAKLSLNLLRSRLALKMIRFQELDIHIHFPQGSTPKDGPSAGITIFTALASLLTGKEVDSNLAMTGELTLSGRVFGVGGIKEKLLGAQRAGIKKVLIPEENSKDLENIPQEIKEQLEIITVSTVDEVLNLALGITIAPHETMWIQQDISQ